MVATSEMEMGWKESQRAHKVFAAEVGDIPKQIVAGHAHAMRDKIARCYPLAGHRIVQLEFGQVLPHRLFPIDFALIIEHSHGKRSEGFGDGADGKDGFGCDRKIAFDIAQTEAV